MPIVSFYAVNNVIWILIDSLSSYPYKVKPLESAVYSAGVAASSLASAGASSAGACSALPPA